MCRKPLGASLCGPRTARGLWPGLDVAVNGSGGGGGGASQYSGSWSNISPPDQDCVITGQLVLTRFSF